MLCPLKEIPTDLWTRWLSREEQKGANSLGNRALYVAPFLTEEHRLLVGQGPGTQSQADTVTAAASPPWRKRVRTWKTNGCAQELQLPLDPLFSMKSHVSDHSWLRHDVLLHVLEAVRCPVLSMGVEDRYLAFHSVLTVSELYGGGDHREFNWS